jgi:hypothetical protein
MIFMASPFDRRAAQAQDYFVLLAEERAVVAVEEQAVLEELVAGGSPGHAGWKPVDRNWLHWG